MVDELQIKHTTDNDRKFACLDDRFEFSQK